MELIKFTAKISKLGPDRRIVEIPKDQLSKAKPLEKKQLKVTLEELKL